MTPAEIRALRMYATHARDSVTIARGQLRTLSSGRPRPRRAHTIGFLEDAARSLGALISGLDAAQHAALSEGEAT